MVRSIDPRRVAFLRDQWLFEAAEVLGTHAAETILASDHVRLHPKAGHMDASDPINFSAQPLQEGAVHIWDA
ncbi:hypothetical protein WSK_1969 [Novosphingobium sp. Rr 2-17]|nr:hypothetical protein WSK_1969 [Novosphingobium sp. Rr 2-17]